MQIIAGNLCVIIQLDLTTGTDAKMASRNPLFYRPPYSLSEPMPDELSFCVTPIAYWRHERAAGTTAKPYDGGFLKNLSSD